MPLPPTDPKELFKEFVSLLREASDIEQALMVQYLYACNSIKLKYEALRGQGSLSEHFDLLGVAIEEMRHLHIVSLLLKRLNEFQKLEPLTFPFDSEYYPFLMDLEALSARTLAHYVFVEAPAAKINPKIGQDPSQPDYAFIYRLYQFLGREDVPNLLAGLYGRIIEIANQMEANPPDEIKHLMGEFPTWIKRLKRVQTNGLEDHFEFFKELFMGRSKAVAFGTSQNVWDLPDTHEDFPSRCLSRNIGAYPHLSAPAQKNMEDLVTLGNLHYWMVFGFLNLTYQFDDWRDPDDEQTPRPYLILARQNMRGALLKLGLHLADSGVGLAFATFPYSYDWGNWDEALRVMQGWVEQADQLAHELDKRGSLPNGFKLNLYSIISSGLRQSGTAPSFRLRSIRAKPSRD